MTHTSEVSAVETLKAVRATVTLGEAFRRILFPFALFGIVLLALLLLSWKLLLPAFTRIDFEGAPQDPAKLESTVRDMRAKLAHVEEKRLALILPLDDSPYGGLVRAKIATPSFSVLLHDLRATARTFLPAQPEAVLLSSFVWGEDRAARPLGEASLAPRAVTVTGDVRNVGLQSMAVLARYVEAVKGIRGVDRVDFPSFQRERDPAIGFHSPFVFSIHLK